MKQLFVLFATAFCLLWTTTQVEAQCRQRRFVDDRHCTRFAQTHLRLGGTLHGVGGAATPRIGTTVGLVHEWHFLPFFQIRGEANALWQGSEENFWSTNDADYISVNAPLMLQFRLSPGLYIAGGAGVSYLLHTQGGAIPGDRFGFDWVGVLHYRFGYTPIGLELRYMHRMGSDLNAIADPTTGVRPFNPTSIQAAFTIRF